MSDTPRHPELDEIIDGNPAVDADQLREAQEEFKKLSESGVSRPGYGIRPPHERLPLTREPGERKKP